MSKLGMDFCLLVTPRPIYICKAYNNKQLENIQKVPRNPVDPQNLIGVALTH